MPTNDPAPADECWCETCRPNTMTDSRMILCPDCGNKRCPRATHHGMACTGSNELGQPGSSWEHVAAPADLPAPAPVGLDTRAIRERWQHHVTGDGRAVHPAVLLAHIPVLLDEVERLRAAEGVLAWERDHAAQLMRERNTYLAERDALRAAVVRWVEADITDGKELTEAEAALADIARTPAADGGERRETP